MHNIESDLDNRPRTNVNVPIRSPYITSYFMIIVTFSLSVTSYEIFIKAQSQYHVKKFDLENVDKSEIGEIRRNLKKLIRPNSMLLFKDSDGRPLPTIPAST